MMPEASKQPHKAGFSTRPLSFGDLPGWAEDDLEAALAVLRITLDLYRPDLRRAAEGPARAFFERYFAPTRHGDGSAHFTGYYEPEIAASPERTERFCHPIYAPPPDLTPRWHSRAEIEDSGILQSRGLEIAWLEDPIEAFFLQVQGSGRLVFPDGGGLRVGFAAKNGQPYASIGQELIRRKEIAPHVISAEAVKEWIRQNGTHILRHNPSFVFFKVLDVPPDVGPLGAMDRPVTAQRSIAVDPKHVPLGAPVWTVINGVGRLCVAQDIGSAIQGQGRADLFCGTGATAGAQAGALNTQGTLVMLAPKEPAK